MRVEPSTRSSSSRHGTFGIAAVDLRGRAEDHLLLMLERQLEERLRAVDVDVEHLERIADVVLDADDRREVVDEIGLGDQAFEDLEVEDAVAHVVEARIAHEVARLGDRAVVEHEHLVAAREECVGQMRADEAAAAGDQNFHVEPHSFRDTGAARPVARGVFLVVCRAARGAAAGSPRRSARPTPSSIPTTVPGAADRAGAVRLRPPHPQRRPLPVANAPGYGWVTARTRL